MTSVLEQKASGQGSTVSVTLTTMPTASQGALAVIARRDNANDYNAVVSGGGATWTRIYKHMVGPSTYDQTVEVWKGVGFTSTPTVQAVSPVTSHLTVFHIDGDVNLATVERGADWGADGSKIGPTKSVSGGSAVIGVIGSRYGYPAIVPNVKVPADGWSSVVASGEISGWQQFWTLYRNTSVTEDHHLEANDANLPASVLQIVVPPMPPLVRSRVSAYITVEPSVPLSGYNGYFDWQYFLNFAAPDWNPPNVRYGAVTRNITSGPIQTDLVQAKTLIHAAGTHTSFGTTPPDVSGTQIQVYRYPDPSGAGYNGAPNDPHATFDPAGYPPGGPGTGYWGWTDPEHGRWFFGPRRWTVEGTTGDDPFWNSISLSQDQINTPLDIPGCILWVSSDDMRTKLAADAGAATWTDLSSFGHHLTAALPGTPPVLSGTGGKSGGPAMQFSAASLNGFNLPAAIAAKVNAANGATVAATVQSGSRGDEGMWALQNASDRGMSHLPSGGRMYDGALGSGRWDWAIAASTWYRYRVLSNKNPAGNPDWSAWLDGTNKINAQAQAGYGLRSDAVIGHSLGAGGVPNMSFGGRFGTVVMYDRLLTSTEQAQLDDWMVRYPSGGIKPITVPPLYLGSTKVSKLILGSSEITTAYLGGTKL